MKKINLLVLFISLFFVCINVFALEVNTDAYDLFVGEEQFTKNKLTIEDGKGGTATYDPEKNVLTVKDFNYEGPGVKQFTIKTMNYSEGDSELYKEQINSGIYSGIRDLNIVFEGTNNFILTDQEDAYESIRSSNEEIQVWDYSLVGIALINNEDSELVFSSISSDTGIDREKLSVYTIGGNGTVNFKIGYSRISEGVFSCSNLILNDGVNFNIDVNNKTEGYSGIDSAFLSINNANIKVENNHDVRYGTGISTYGDFNILDGQININIDAQYLVNGIINEVGVIGLDGGKINIILNGLNYSYGNVKSAVPNASEGPDMYNVLGVRGIGSYDGKIILNNAELSINLDSKIVEEPIIEFFPGDVLVTTSPFTGKRVGIVPMPEDEPENPAILPFELPARPLVGLIARNKLELNGGKIKVTIPKYGFIYVTGEGFANDEKSFSYQDYKSFKYQYKDESEVENIIKKDNYLLGVYYEADFYTYLLVNGDKQTLNKLSSTYSLEIDGNPEKLTKVLIDGVEFEKDKDYTVEGDKVIFTESGIAKITELEPQEYEFEVIYTLDDGDKSVKGTLTVEAPVSEEEPVINPQTFDNIIIYGLIGVISLIGLYILFINKKRFN